MIDGVNISTHAANDRVRAWNIWETRINIATGQRVSDIDTANFRGLDLRLKRNAATATGLRLTINGSLHKYHNRGKHNADRFTFGDLQKSIGSLASITAISPDDFHLHGLEIGVNIPLPYSPQRILKNLVSYGNRPFDQLDKKSRDTGLQCTLQNYKLKIYDKGKQSRTGGNVLRFEVAIKKMAALKKYGISTLADLRDPAKVAPLVEVLYNAYDSIIWTDTAANLNRLSSRELKKWLAYSNPRTWESMTKQNKTHHLRQWKTLLNTHAKRYDLKTAIGNEWKRLIDADLSHEKPQLQAGKNVTFYPLEYTGKRYNMGLENIDPKHNQKKPEKSPTPKSRFCQSCGNDISRQNPNSKFCSAKTVGKKRARQCRNKDSNRRLSIKRKIYRAMKNDRFLQITYTVPGGDTFTDILHPKEIHLSKKWLDRVQTVTTLRHGSQLDQSAPPPPERHGKAARRYLRREVAKANKQDSINSIT